MLARSGNPAHVYLLRAAIALLELMHDLIWLPETLGLRELLTRRSSGAVGSGAAGTGAAGTMERGKPQTWGGEANDALFTDAGVITTGGAIHSRVAWFCRGQPRVKQACAPRCLPQDPT